jgi:hypothetical protein
VIVLVFKLIILLVGPALAGPKEFCQPNIRSEKELLIVDPTIIDSPSALGDGFLSFGSIFKLFSRARSGAAAKLALVDWLGEWERTRLESGVPAIPRSTERLKWLWPKDSDENLSLIDAPFVLSAILYRPDLSGGEMRFVFNLINPTDGGAKQFTTIFEFPLEDSREVWSKDFHKLGALPWGNSFLEALQVLVSKLNPRDARIRTNDFFLAFVWDLREFRLGLSGKIELQPLQMTPLLDFNEGTSSQDLFDWVEKFQTQVGSGNYTLDSKFQTANAFAPNEGFKWLASTNLPESLRHTFSLHTCNGCHTGETLTRFTHIEPRARLGASRTSDFLQKDLLDRKMIFEKILCGDRRSLHRLMAPRVGFVD